MTGSDAYIFGAEREEIIRLAQQHRLWSDTCVAHWHRARFGPGQSLLDLGSGPGFATLDLAELVGPAGRVLAVERDPTYAAFLRGRLGSSPESVRAAVTVWKGPAEDLTLEPGTLDGVYARWVFTFIQEPVLVLRALHAGLRPGGTLAILDYLEWKSIAWGPRNEVLDRIRPAILAMYAEHQADSEVGKKLPKALVDAGFELVDLRPLNRIVRPHDPTWNWPKIWLNDFLPKVVEHGHAEPDIVDAWRAEWAANEADPAGFLVTPPQIEVVARR